MVLCHRHILTNHSQSSRFITERGVPMLANTADNTLNLTIGTTGRQAIYAYRDSTVVGKVNVQAYSYKDVKVHLVRVNGATKRLDVEAISKGVNEIFDDAVVRYTFDELDPITIEYANKERFVHGGKGTFQNYNEDQKTAIKALPETADPNDYYLFFTDCYNRLDTAGNVSNDPVSGYMPVGRHYGFIYNEYTNTRTIAHELAHGTNALHHTFSPESETFYTTSKTDNLMDYNGGKYLNHSQWQWSHEKHRNVLGFLDDEGEGEMLAAISVVQILEAIKIDNQKGNNCTDLSLWAGKKSFENKLTLSDNLILEYIDVNIALTKNANNKNNPLQIEPLQINPILLHTTKVEVSSGEDEQFVKIYYNRIGKKTLAETSASEQNEEAISFVIKESQLGELKTYLNLMQTADATWVSQFNKNIFGNCSCWRGSCCFQCCQYIVKNNTNMYSPAASRVAVMKFPIAKRPLAEMQTPILAGDLQQAIDYINKSIAENKPVVAGVYYRKKQEDIKRDVDKILPNLNEERKKLAKILHDIEYEENNIDLLREKEQGQDKVDSLQAKYDKANKMPYNAIEPTFHFIVIDGKGFDVNKKQYYYHFLEVGTESNMKGTNENNRLYIYNTEIKGTRGFDTREYILTEIRKHSLSGDACP